MGRKERVDKFQTLESILAGHMYIMVHDDNLLNMFTVIWHDLASVEIVKTCLVFALDECFRILKYNRFPGEGFMNFHGKW